LKVIWSPLAIDRAVEQARYIAKDNPGAAEKWLKGLFVAAEQLERLPRLGRMVPEWENSEFRELSYGRYRIIYRIEAQQLSILTVRHSSRLLDPTELHPSGD
jgi:plasmid stabilization system protein ParE